MKFTTNTKPLAEALNLGIIDSNISNFYKKSCIAQITATTDTLIVNVESSMICTEIRVKGVGEDGEFAKAFVDAALFKKLIHTFESNVCIEFDANGIKLQSGRSKFSLGNSIGDAVSIDDFSLKAPATPAQDAEFVEVNKDAWKFIKDNQMFAASESYTKPVYTKAWISENGDVLVGDFDASLFTYSKKGTLGTTCLLSNTIINLFNSLPESAQMTKLNKDYIIKFSKDAYDYVTQFTPQYESDEEVGSYKSDLIFTRLVHPEKSNKVFTGLITKLLNQTSLLSSASSIIKLSVKDGSMYLDSENVNGQIEIDGDESLEYSVNFRLDTLKQVISNYGDRWIEVGPMYYNPEDPTSTIVGIMIWNEELTTICAGVMG